MLISRMLVFFYINYQLDSYKKLYSRQIHNKGFKAKWVLFYYFSFSWTKRECVWRCGLVISCCWPLPKQAHKTQCRTVFTLAATTTDAITIRLNRPVAGKRWCNITRVFITKAIKAIFSTVKGFKLKRNETSTPL